MFISAGFRSLHYVYPENFVIVFPSLISSFFPIYIGLVLDEYYKSQWFQNVYQKRAISGQARNKLRTYRQHKTQFKAEDYLIKVVTRKHCSALAKFRVGVDPIRLETGRYEGLEVDERECPICKNKIEAEEHVITRCPSYSIPMYSIM